jgi:hypothetical protein
VVTLRIPGVKTFTATRSFSVSQANVKQVFTSASPTQRPVAANSSSSSTIWVLIAAIAVGALVVVSVLFWRLRRRPA